MTDDQKQRALALLEQEPKATREKSTREIDDEDEVPPTVRMKTFWWKEPSEEPSSKRVAR